MTSIFRFLIPTQNHITLKRVAQSLTTKSGIQLLQSNEYNFYGEVVEVGSGTRYGDKLVPTCVKKGDVVLVPQFGGTEVKLKEGSVFLYRDTEILGILKQ